MLSSVKLRDCASFHDGSNKEACEAIFKRQAVFLTLFNVTCHTSLPSPDPGLDPVHRLKKDTASLPFTNL